MKSSNKCMTAILAMICFFSSMAYMAGTTRAEEIRYDGTYQMAPNGDMAITIKLTPPMALYQKLRDSVSNLYLILRGFASSRADAEVVNKKAEWDDPDRTVVISMTVLGTGRNLGNRWEVDIPKDAAFSNLDEGKKTFYFNETLDTGSNAVIRGVSRLVLPAAARQFKWEPSRRVASYELPPVSTSSGMKPVLMILSIVFVVVGAGMTAGSFLVKS
jgi:hypothetical protein